VFVERLMVQYRDGWRWAPQENGSRAYFSYVYNFFFDNSFFPLAAILWICNIKPTLLWRKMYILCINTDTTDVDTDSHTSFRFHIYEKETRIFREQIFFFLFIFRELQWWWFSLAAPAFGYQYVCIAFNRKCKIKKRNHLPSCLHVAS
jgi:hypothetical protein